MGTQCHPEMTAQDILFLIDTYLADAGNAEGIQDYDTIKKGVDLYAADANQKKQQNKKTNNKKKG